MRSWNVAGDGLWEISGYGMRMMPQALAGCQLRNLQQTMGLWGFGDLRRSCCGFLMSGEGGGVLPFTHSDLKPFGLGGVQGFHNIPFPRKASGEMPKP